ncbi:MAG: TRAP transporter fused permease subunit, partial [Rhodospirillaceae bacterium]|nr:TRAP transporter fused permease subunit [Rhodospirillaceae bacterium]
RSGFPARFAAGVEASASTGGQLMPPIMGAGAFVMANLTGIQYLDIVAVSFLPALLYFLGIAFYVRIEAKRRHLYSFDADAPRVMTVLRQGGVAFLLPIAVLIGMLVKGFTPTYAAGFAIVAVVAASWLTPNRMGPRKILEALALGARNMILTAVLLVSVGLIVNVIATTGVGNTFSLMIAAWSGNSVLIAIVLIAIASLVLGMGLPVTAAYIVLATLSAPALRDLILQSEMVSVLAGSAAPASFTAVFLLFTPDQLVAAAAAANVTISPDMAAALAAAVPAGDALTGAQASALISLLNVPDVANIAGNVASQVMAPAVVTTALLSAHMIIFWLSQDSNVTPPVCLTAFAAAAIAGSGPMATGLTAWKIAKVLYIVPLLFAYTPFLNGDLLTALHIFLFGVLGVYALIAAIEGHAEAPYPWFARPILAAIGVALLWPSHIMINVAGTALLVAFMVWNIRTARHLAASR